ncbi:VWA domain-containing protein [Streptomyces sp. NPDC058773]|uniref:vWA domain-containing protein n=1 Tax=Streptomyces sp. NPDC058773 TaxID=3346632 RepID=UPI00368D5283
MGIRSLLRNAFGRSKAAREETGAAPSGADKPESATIPEAREESTPAPAAPEAEVPAARTAPAEAPATDPAPTTPTLPAQGGPADRADRSAESAPAQEESVAAAAPEEAAGPDAAEVRDEPVAEVGATATADVPDAPDATDATDASDAAAEPVEATEAAGAEAKGEPTAGAEAKRLAEPEVVAEPEATAGPATETAAEAEAGAEAPAETEEPEAKSAEPVAAPATEPVTEPAADAETAAQPEDEPKAAAPQATAPKAEEPEAEPVTPAAPASGAAASLPSAAPALVSLYKSAGSTLDKHGLGSQRAAVYLVLDRSGSMRHYYKDGTVQNLAEQALGLSAHLDDDATVPVIFFSTDIDGTADIDLTNYEGRIEELHAGLGHMGRTNYHWAINAVVEHYKKSGATAPAFVIFQTDGAPTSKPAAEKALCEAAGLPIFWQFIGFGDPDAKGFDFLRKLDDLAVPEKRAVDNAGFFHAGRDPRSLSHDELYQQLMVEFPEWLSEARAAGVLKDS